MGIGPILLFDKSSLESLSVDESVWFDTFYYPNITPLFFVETLADLEKEVDRGRTPEQVVGNLAEKTPTGGHVNVYHTTLSVNELLGQEVEMRHVAVVAGGRPVRAGGKRGVVFDEPPERGALIRWQQGKFLEVERQFARVWRKGLSGVNLDALYRTGRRIIERNGRPKDLAEARTIALALLDKPGSRHALRALESLPVADRARRVIVGQWRAQGSPPLKTYAPYTAHVVSVDLFFCIAMGAELVGRERPSNKIDMAYLYYLPFCMGFTSKDNLHVRTAPLFMDPVKQVFVSAHDLKADLAKLDAYYSALPEDVKKEGVMSFAHHPPTDGDFLVTQLWDKLMAPRWREQATRPEPKMSQEKERELIEMIRAMGDAPRDDSAAREAEKHDAVMFQRMVPVRRGKWRLVPPGAEEAERRARGSGKSETTPL